MSTHVVRQTVDLSGYPDLIVIYLGMRVNRVTGIKTLLGFGPKIAASAQAHPDGLLRHETVVYSIFPMHIGMRQYWRDLDSLMAWTRSDPHRQWWKSFLKDSGGTGFWHETYFRRGGMEAIYDDLPQPTGLYGLRARCTGERSHVRGCQQRRQGVRQPAGRFRKGVVRCWQIVAATWLLTSMRCT